MVCVFVVFEMRYKKISADKTATIKALDLKMGHEAATKQQYYCYIAIRYGSSAAIKITCSTAIKINCFTVIEIYFCTTKV